MKHFLTRIVITFLITLFLVVALKAQTAAISATSKMSVVEEFKAEFESVPCKNKDRLSAVKALFEKMGAAPAEIQVDNAKGVENVIIRKAGVSPETIIIGAHYDKTADGCGAIDNWSGVVSIAHLYRTVKDLPMQKTILFVAFGREEEGLIGSKRMAKEIKKEDVQKYCAMINIDSLGLSVPQVLDNVSSPKMLALAEETSTKLEIKFSHAKDEHASADSVSFLEKKIPAITIHGLTNEWPKILHSSNDQAKQVNPVSIYLGYRLTLAMMMRLSEAECQAYR